MGILAEDKASRFIESLGYQVIARNFRSKFGELDIVAKEKDVLVFIEVRYRRKNSMVKPEESIDKRKMRKLMLAIRDFLGKNPVPCSGMRVDLCSVSAAHEPAPQDGSDSIQFTFNLIKDILSF